jgi:hypothetical protein
MTHKMKSMVVPLLVIAVGLGWLLTVKNVLPGVNWVWVLGLGLAGVLTLAVGGIDKVTLVLGPFLIMATVFSLLRQTGRMAVDIEVPALVIVLGLLLLAVQVLPVPTPKWYRPPPGQDV